MANDISTKVWDLDTAGVISVNPVIVDGVSITWTTTVGTVKSVVMSHVRTDDQTAGAEIFSATASSTTVGEDITKFYPLQGTFEGLHLTTITSAAKILVYTK